MTEMVERVAKDLTESFGYRVFEEGDAELLARNAIAAMREPTSAMIETVSGAMYDHFTSADIPLAPKDAEVLRARLRKAAGDNWRAMIDAALKE
jgi:hypothetical protein